MLQSERGNKAAGLRARKASLELEWLTEAFHKTNLRKASLELEWLTEAFHKTNLEAAKLEKYSQI